MKISIRIVTFILSICCAQAHTVIKLSETPWMFSKEELATQNISSLISGLDVNNDMRALFDGDIETEWSNNNKSAELMIDLGKKYALSGLKIKLEANIYSVSYKIEGADAINGSWQVLADYLKNPQECVPERVGEMGEVGSTVGYLQRIDYTYVNPFLDGCFQFLKLNIDNVRDTDGMPVDIEMKDIDILVHAGALKNDPKQYTSLDYDDSNWQTVGLPHCYNDRDSYLNSTSTFIWKGNAWYRNKFRLNKKDRDKRFFLEFKSIGIAAGVYINGTFKEGNTRIKQPGNLTHIGCFIPFMVDITDELSFEKENILAVQVSNAPNSFFTWPNFGVWEAFGMGWGGIYSEVNLHIVDNVYIPENAYSASGEWGTYNAVKSADEQNAELVFHTNVKNTTLREKKLDLLLQLLDHRGVVAGSVKSAIVLQPGATRLVESEMKVSHPNLWYPNNSEHGKPYLYKIRRTISEGNKVKDQTEEYLGIRTIEWDEDFCYVNGKKHILRGFGHRNMYPALGCAMPEELQWKDISYIAQCGGNTLRVGHAAPLPAMLEACDQYGIMVILNSGDNEWSLKNEPALTYKREYDRNAILAFRNHPSVIVWESNNGLAKDGDIYYPSYTLEIAEKYDPVNTRIVLNRDWYPPQWDKNKPVVVGFTNWYTKIDGSPSLNTEVYGANWEGRASWNIARFDYDNEKRFTQWYVNNYLSDLKNRACGWLDWMLAETQGENYTIYLNGKRDQKSLGSCAMDANRFPKLKYRVYEKALWVAYENKPGVALQSTWDFDYPVQNIDVWSNCPYVEVLVNDKSYGVKENNSPSKQCTWENIVWERGRVLARGLNQNREVCCADTLYSSETPSAIELTLEPLLVKPDGTGFARRANGSDVAILTAKVVDKGGRLCTRAGIPLFFEVDGAGAYCGSADFYITEGKPVYYHSPGDKELQSEGGLMRIAVKSTFEKGAVDVKVSSPGLQSGLCRFRFADN